MASRQRGPNLSSHVCSFLIERKHNAIRGKGLERLHLPFERLPIPDGDTIPTHAFEDGYRSDRQSPEIGQVGQRSFGNVRISSAQLRQRVGIEHGRLVHESEFSLSKLAGEKVAV